MKPEETRPRRGAAVIEEATALLEQLTFTGHRGAYAEGERVCVGMDSRWNEDGQTFDALVLLHPRGGQSVDWTDVGLLLWRQVDHLEDLHAARPLGPRGSFVFEHLPPGRYRADLVRHFSRRAAAADELRSLLRDAIFTDGAGLSVCGEQVGAEVRVRPAESGDTFDATVTVFPPDGEWGWMAGLPLFLRGRTTGSDRLLHGLTSRQGDVSFPHLPPGEYVLRLPDSWGRAANLQLAGLRWAAETEGQAALPAPLIHYSQDRRVKAVVGMTGEDEPWIGFSTEDPDLAGATVWFALVAEEGRVELSGEVTLKPPAEPELADQPTWVGRYPLERKPSVPCELVFEVLAAS
jgi:hypothetical protein